MQATLVATLTEAPDSDLLARLSRQSSWLEVRADLLGDLEPEWLRSHYDGQLLYTLRSATEGGGSDEGESQRRSRLAAAAGSFDLVDLEVARDLSEELLQRIPPRQRILSWHGPAVPQWSLRERFETMAAHGARLYKLVPAAGRPGEELAPLALLKSLGRDDLVAFASGAQGTWTRLIAPRLGAAVIYAAVGGLPGAPGQPSLERLRADYGLPEMLPIERLYGICGHPVAHSLSPRLHNGAYRQLGVPALYVPFDTASFGDFWLDVVERGSLGLLGIPLLGLSVTAPCKDAALAVSGASSPLAQRLGAANTLVFRSGVWEAESTDPAGVVGAVRGQGVSLLERRAAVVGAGGAGRAAAAGLELSGSRVAMVNRSVEKGRRAASRLGLPFVPLERFQPSDFDLVVNATMLGHGEQDPLPFDPAGMKPGSAVLDLVYGHGPTRLVEAAREAGLVAVDGREVLLHQALRQFQLMTGQELPEDLGRELLELSGGEGP